MTQKTVHLYIDDSGSRDPDRSPKLRRLDGMDYFAFGGILVRNEDVDQIFQSHVEFCRRWQIDYPLHSAEIRGQRSNFAWLARDDVQKQAFLTDLQDFVLGLPVIAIAVVIDRPGYVQRYKDRYADGTWLMCKTAFSILSERAAKFARSRKAQLEIFFEQAGKKEDRALKAYGRALKIDGMPFDAGTSAAYSALQPADFRALIIGEPRERTKSTPMMQVADLVLYPLAKGGYDPTYAPYLALFQHEKVVDAVVSDSERASLGVKYSCFGALKKQDPALAGS